MAIKLLIGGSPCTHWSIAQKNNRETTAEGLGWELFKNYLIAKEKFNPDFYLYENNKSAAQAIKDQIAKELGVGTDPNARFTYINSALVSAQNRQRFYVTNFGDIEQPHDRGIVIRDILDNVPLSQRRKKPMPRVSFKKNYAQFDVSGKGYNSEQDRAYYIDGKFGCLPSARANTKVKVCVRGEDTYFDLNLDEVKALQTMPKSFKMPLFNGKPNISMIGLGNGWTAEVIIHLLQHALKDVPKDEEIIVLSMYDGIGTGRYCLDKMGFTNVKYYAYEIDKYAMTVALDNFPDIVQCGDAFAVREDDWDIEKAAPSVPVIGRQS